MKKSIAVLLFLFSLASFSQGPTLGETSKEINREKGRFYMNGKQLSTRETRELLASNSAALASFKKGKSKESIGGFLIGFGGALLVADVVVGLVSDVQYPTAATYVGAAAILTSIPVLSGKNKKIDRGIELYNADQKKIGHHDFDVELNVIANQNGYGLQLQF